MGSIINTVAIIAGGLVGLFVGKLFTEEQQDALIKTCGVSVLFIAIAGAMEGMLSLEEGALHSGKGMFVVLCLAMGTIIGELIGIEKAFERFGEWLKAKTGNSGDRNFVNAFVTASLTVCIGAMAIVGSIQDGILGDYSTLAVKSVLDFIIVAVMTSSLGKGCAFSAIPILLFEGGINYAPLSVRKLVEAALREKATGVILAHNHPAGQAIPSVEDREATLQIRSALEAMEIRLLDHIIVAGEDYISMEECGHFRR